MRMYSLFHDLTHNSLFASREANTPLGPRCSGSSSSRRTAGGSASTASTTRTPATSTSAGPGEIYTMTVAEYESASRPAAARLPPLPQPAADAARRPEPRVPVRAPLPAARDDPEDPRSASWRRTSRSRPGSSAGARSSAGRPSAHPGHDAGRGRRDRRVDALHPAPVRGHLLPGGRRVAVRARRAPGQLVPRAAARRSPGRSATPTTTTCTTSARRSRTTACAPRTRSSRCSRSTPVVTLAQQHRRASA